MTAKQDFLDPLLARMPGDGVADLYLDAGYQPTVLVRGKIRPVTPDAQPLDEPTVRAILQEVAGDDVWAEFLESLPRRGTGPAFRVRLDHGDAAFLVTIRNWRGISANFRLLATRRRPAVPAKPTMRQDLLDPILTRMAAEAVRELLLTPGSTPHSVVRGTASPFQGTIPMSAETLLGMLEEIAGFDTWMDFRVDTARGNEASFSIGLVHEGSPFLLTARTDKRGRITASVCSTNPLDPPAPDES